MNDSLDVVIISINYGTFTTILVIEFHCLDAKFRAVVWPLLTSFQLSSARSMPLLHLLLQIFARIRLKKTGATASFTVAPVLITELRNLTV